MSMADFTKVCPICGDELHISNFQVADVWKDNKKQRLFVCRHCANRQQSKRNWANPQDEFKRLKGRR